jgi:methylenetetrahydrofolate--tRNA-(uracil-5-)-methyltransferase
MDNRNGITVVGAGLAGSEAAWQIAGAGIPVRLVEMRPNEMTPAHSTGDFGELVCSNSLGSKSPSNAGGILKEEMRILGSLVMKAADTASP